MEAEDGKGDEEEFGFSRNYFLAKELGTPKAKKLRKKLSDIEPLDEHCYPNVLIAEKQERRTILSQEGCSRLQEQELRAAASSLVAKHEKETASLLKSYRSLYSRWSFELRFDINKHLTFFGSQHLDRGVRVWASNAWFWFEKALLEDFASTMLDNYGVVVINGYLQSINIKHAVASMADILWYDMKSKGRISSRNMSKVTQPFSSQSMEELLLSLDGSQSKENDCIVCAVIHNIDGPALRDGESQQYLARLAGCSQVRVIASVDHVNSLLCGYRPIFMTSNAQDVFRILAEHQLGHPNDEGLPLNMLHAKCREKFLVSGQVTLNSHLTEFKDHELVRTRKNCDGVDCLYIPLAAEVLEKLLQDIV